MRRRVSILILAILIFLLGGVAHAGLFRNKTVALQGFTYIGNLTIPNIGIREDGEVIHVFNDSGRKCYVYLMQGHWDSPTIAVLPYGEVPPPEENTKETEAPVEGVNVDVESNDGSD